MICIILFSKANPNNTKGSMCITTLITEDIKSFAVVAHPMEHNKEVNLGERPVVTGDRPVYALCKQMQLMSSTLKNFFCENGRLAYRNGILISHWRLV